MANNLKVLSFKSFNYQNVVSWREACSSIRRFVTGGSELQTPDFAWKFVWTVQPNDKVQCPPMK